MAPTGTDKADRMTTMTSPMSTKQADYRTSLINDLAGKAEQECRKPQDVLAATFALALRVPADSREASAQIDALKGGVKALGLVAGGQPVLDRILAAWGNDLAGAPVLGTPTRAEDDAANGLRRVSIVPYRAAFRAALVAPLA